MGRLKPIYQAFSKCSVLQFVTGRRTIMKLGLRLICAVLLVCISVSTSCAEEGVAFPTGIHLDCGCCTTGGEIILGGHADKTTYLYSYPAGACSAGMLSAIPMLTIENAYCYDIQEYDHDTIAVLCLEPNEGSGLSHIYHVSKAQVTSYLTCPYQVFSMC